MHMQAKLRRGLCGVLLVVSAVGNVQGATQIGSTRLAKGVTTAQHGSAPVRFLGPDTAIFEGDTISVGRRSFAILELSDGTRLILRPNTVMQMESFNTQAQQEQSVLRLFKGGMRAVTGFLSKRNPRAFSVATPVATIGIRGTTFDARWCEADCAADAADIGAGSATVKSLVVGRVALGHGNVRRVGTGGDAQQLLNGSSLYAGDTIRTGDRSYAVMAFRDQGRVTLTPNSEFQIEEFMFDSATPASSTSVMRLLRGGLRAVSGLIGRNRPDNYRIRTTVATIGVRGTGFDLLCRDGCATTPGHSSAYPASRTWSRLLGSLVPAAWAAPATGPGLVAQVWDGGITLFELPGGDLIINAGQAVFVPANGDAPVFLDIPVEFDAPRLIRST